MFAAKVVAMAGLLASGALAADVYSTFYTSSGTANSPNYDVGNNGCFSTDDATTVAFTHADPSPDIDGPYCLNAYADGGCPGLANGQQTFQNLIADVSYSINAGVANAGSYKWSLEVCNGT